jgi:hypothetical protein
VSQERKDKVEDGKGRTKEESKEAKMRQEEGRVSNRYLRVGREGI